MHSRFVSHRCYLLPLLPTLMLLVVGCGTTRSYTATEQLVMSDAVDRSIAQLDFRPLSGSKVYLDTSYLRHVKGEGFVNAEYVTSALRQQIVAAGCLIQDANTEAEIVIEVVEGSPDKVHSHPTGGRRATTSPGRFLLPSSRCWPVCAFEEMPETARTWTWT